MHQKTGQASKVTEQGTPVSGELRRTEMGETGETAPAHLRAAAKRDEPLISVHEKVLKDMSKADRKFVEQTSPNVLEKLRESGLDVFPFPGEFGEGKYFGGSVTFVAKQAQQVEGEKITAYAYVAISPRKTFDISTRETGTLFFATAGGCVDFGKSEEAFTLPQLSYRRDNPTELPGGPEFSVERLRLAFQSKLERDLESAAAQMIKARKSDIIMEAMNGGSAAMLAKHGITKQEHQVRLRIPAEDLPFKEARVRDMDLDLKATVEVYTIPKGYNDLYLNTSLLKGTRARVILDHQYGSDGEGRIAVVGGYAGLPLSLLPKLSGDADANLKAIQARLRTLANVVKGREGDVNWKNEPVLHLAVFQALRLPRLLDAGEGRLALSLQSLPTTLSSDNGVGALFYKLTATSDLLGEIELGKVNFYSHKVHYRGNTLIVPDGKLRQEGLYAIIEWDNRKWFHGKSHDVFPLGELGTPLGAADGALAKAALEAVERLEATHRENQETAKAKDTVESLKAAARQALEAHVAKLGSHVVIDHFHQGKDDPTIFNANLLEKYAKGTVKHGLVFSFSEGQIKNLTARAGQLEVYVDSARLEAVRELLK